jgi:hypothetical protein
LFSGGGGKGEMECRPRCFPEGMLRDRFVQDDSREGKMTMGMGMLRDRFVQDDSREGKMTMGMGMLRDCYCSA